MTPKPSVTVTRKYNRVTTWRAGRTVVQTHRMYQAVVRLPGDPEVHRCCGRHQKAKAAQQCGERLARRLTSK